MSTKIYDAFRVKPGVDIWELLWKIRDRGAANAKTCLAEHYRELIRQMNPESDVYIAAHRYEGQSEVSFRLGVARDFVRDNYRKEVTRGQRDPYSLDISVGVYPLNGRYYLRTFCDSCTVVGTALDFVPTLPELEDYHYQNQSDPPSEVPEEDWAERAKVWDEVIGNNEGLGNHVVLDILSWSGFYQLDPWRELAQHYRDSPVVLPTREEVLASNLAKLRAFTSVVVEYPGLIVAQPGEVTIQRARTRWVTTIAGKKKFHKTLDLAADHVYCEHLPESTKAWLQRRKEDDAARAKAKAKAKKT